MAYTKHTWVKGELITADKLNHIENGIGSVEGLPGPQGPKGDKGDTGPAGPPGPKGDSASSITLSEAPNNAILKKEDGFWVEDKTEQISVLRDTLNSIAARKFTNGATDYLVKFAQYSANTTETVNIGGQDVNLLKYLPDSVGNLEYTSDHYIKLNKGKTYLVKGKTFAHSTQAMNCFIMDSDKKVYGSRGYNDTTPYYSQAFVNAVIKAEDDIFIAIIISRVPANSEFYVTLSWFSVEEIGQSVEIDPLNYVNEREGIEDTPVGHILAHMGITAPKHYLICDGTEYHIADYPHLANHIKDSFGSYSHFGGDGTTTFCVPDLRNEFLRGYHGEAAEQLSGVIGEHQDGTMHTNVCTNEVSSIISHDIQHISNDEINSRNADKIISDGKTRWIPSTNINTKDVRGYDYTSHPTNTAVLYCIKYEPTYFMQLNGNMITDCLWSGSISKDGDEAVLSRDLSDYNIIAAECQVINTNGTHRQKISFTIVSDAVQYGSTSNCWYIFDESNKGVDRRIACSFIDSKTLHIYGVSSVTSGGEYLAIKNIYGIGYKSTSSSGQPGGDIPTYTDQEIIDGIDYILSGQEVK